MSFILKENGIQRDQKIGSISYDWLISLLETYLADRLSHVESDNHKVIAALFVMAKD